MEVIEHSYASNYRIATSRFTGQKTTQYSPTCHPLYGTPCQRREGGSLTYFMLPEKMYCPEVGVYKTYSIIAYGNLDAPPIAVARDVSTDGDLVFRMVREFNETCLPPRLLPAAIRDMLG